MNAIYSGPFVTLAKAEFSNSQNANIQKWSAYVKGSANRQEFLERALDWVSKGDIGGYMSAHRNDNNINELKTYFNSVIDWVSTVFIDVLAEMKGLEWGRLYEEYHGKSYDPKKMSDDVKKLAADDYVKSRKGIFEFLLGGSVDTKLLEVRVFDDKGKKSYTLSRRKPEPMASPTVRSARLGTRRTRAESISSTKWTPTTLQHGARAAEARPRTAKCSALPTIGPKVIDNRACHSPARGAGSATEQPVVSGPSAPRPAAEPER